MISFSIKGQLQFWRIQTNSLPLLDIWISMLMKGPLHFWRIQTPAGSSNKLISRCCCQKTSKTKLLIRKFSRAVDPPKVFTGTKVFLFTFVQKYSLGQKYFYSLLSKSIHWDNVTQRCDICNRKSLNWELRQLQCSGGIPMRPKTVGRAQIQNNQQINIQNIFSVVAECQSFPKQKEAPAEL